MLSTIAASTFSLLQPGRSVLRWQLRQYVSTSSSFAAPSMSDVVFVAGAAGALAVFSAEAEAVAVVLGAQPASAQTRRVQARALAATVAVGFDAGMVLGRGVHRGESGRVAARERGRRGYRGRAHRLVDALLQQPAGFEDVRHRARGRGRLGIARGGCDDVALRGAGVAMSPRREVLRPDPSRGGGVREDGRALARRGAQGRRGRPSGGG